MKKLLLLSICLLTFSCTRDLSQVYDYKVIDTTSVVKNGFGATLGYLVIIKIDTTYYSATLDSHSKLVEINRKLKIKNLK